MFFELVSKVAAAAAALPTDTGEKNYRHRREELQTQERTQLQTQERITTDTGEDTTTDTGEKNYRHRRGHD